MHPEGRAPQLPGLEQVEQVGQGTSGSVWKAWQPQFMRWLAVKVVDEKPGRESAERFARECQALGGLSGHPYVVTVLDAGLLPDGRPYLTMPFLAGGSYADRLAASGPLGAEQALDVGVKVCSALHAAHSAGVLHRDVKPENVLISSYDEPVLADFGVARLELASLTRTGTFAATPLHAAPEVMMGKRASASSDVYGLGSSLFRLVAGEAAFLDATDESLFPMLNRIANSPPPDLRPRGIPDPLASVIEQLMAKEPAQRPASALEAGQALQRAQRQLGLSVTRAPGLGVAAGEVTTSLEPVRVIPPLPAPGGLPPYPPIPPLPTTAPATSALAASTVTWAQAGATPPIQPATQALPPVYTGSAVPPQGGGWGAPPGAVGLAGPTGLAGASPPRRTGVLVAGMAVAVLLVGGTAGGVTVALTSGSGPTPAPTFTPATSAAPSPAPTPPAPTSAAPTSAAPTSAAPTSDEPSEEPTSEEPTSEEPSADPTTDATSDGVDAMNTAAGILPTPNDFPDGWELDTITENPERTASEQRVATCTGMPDWVSHETAYTDNGFKPTTGSGVGIETAASVYDDSRAVSALVTATASKKYPSCQAAEIVAAVPALFGDGYTASDVTVVASPYMSSSQVGQTQSVTFLIASGRIVHDGTSTPFMLKTALLAGTDTVAQVQLQLVGTAASDAQNATFTSIVDNVANNVQ